MFLSSPTSPHPRIVPEEAETMLQFLFTFVHMATGKVEKNLLLKIDDVISKIAQETDLIFDMDFEKQVSLENCRFL